MYHSSNLMSLVFVLGFVVASLSASPKPKNYVILFADDFGYGDLSSYGSPSIGTPNLDNLAQNGLLFHYWFSANAICSPSRAALLTGRYAIRSGVANYIKPTDNAGDNVFWAQDSGGLPANQPTIAEYLKSKGFATGMSGKWHLGVNAFNSSDCSHCPTTRGFDWYLGLPVTNSEGCPQGNAPDRCFIYENSTITQQPADYTNMSFRLAQHSIDFMENARVMGKPFFLYHAFLHTHVDLFASKKYKGTSPRGFFGDNAVEMDAAAGAILSYLREKNLDEDTLIFFTSDNGPWLQKQEEGGSSGPLKGGKFQTWNGGIMVPGIISWKGVVTHHSIITPVSTMDMTATILDWEGITPKSDRPLDGVSLKELILNPRNMNRNTSLNRFLFHYCANQLLAASYGSYKIHYGANKYFEIGGSVPISARCGGDDIVRYNPPVVFNIMQDPYEGFPVNISKNVDGKKVLTMIENAVVEHKKSVVGVPCQYDRPKSDKLIPCCDPPKCCCGPACKRKKEL